MAMDNTPGYSLEPISERTDTEPRATRVSPRPEPRSSVVLCGRTLPQASFAERVELAASAGWRYVSLLGSDVPDLASAGMDLAHGATLLADLDVEVAEIEAVVEWLPGGTPPAWLAGLPDERAYYDIADAVGARAVIAADLNGGPMPPLEVAVEAYARLCDRAAGHGLLVCLEFVPWGRIPDLLTAWEVVRCAERPNGGIMLDSWHLFRSGGTLEDVASVPAEWITGLQISDAPESERGARTAQGEQNRLLPGRGVVGIGRLLEVLFARGCTAPIGLEVTSAELAAQPATAVVDLLVDALAEVDPRRS